MAALISGARTECGLEANCREILVVPQQESFSAPIGATDGVAGAERFGAGTWNDGPGYAANSGDVGTSRGGRADFGGGRTGDRESSPDTS